MWGRTLCSIITKASPFIALLFYSPITSAKAQSSVNAQISSIQFVHEKVPIGKVTLEASYESSNSIFDSEPFMPQSEFHFYSFFETDRAGDRSFDIDSSVFRISTFKNNYFWVGRTHPLQEDLWDHPTLTTSAIGARWVQNQSNPFQPRASGWIGTGTHFRDSSTGIFLKACYSPLFLPHFGPSIEFSEFRDATGTRFARLPPQQIQINEQILPLRYRILIGNIRNIILQPQYLVEFGHDLEWQQLSLITWSAPSPSPKISTSGILKVTASDASVLATIQPTFPRQTFYALRWMIQQSHIESEISATYEKSSQQTTLSASLNFKEFIKLGYLTSFEQVPTPAEINSPIYAKNLLWLEATIKLFREKLTSTLHFEQHLDETSQDYWISTNLEYQLSPLTTLFFRTHTIAGHEESYFGNWKALDSIALGGKYEW